MGKEEYKVPTTKNGIQFTMPSPLTMDANISASVNLGKDIIGG